MLSQRFDSPWVKDPPSLACARACVEKAATADAMAAARNCDFMVGSVRGMTRTSNRRAALLSCRCRPADASLPKVDLAQGLLQPRGQLLRIVVGPEVHEEQA